MFNFRRISEDTTKEQPTIWNLQEVALEENKRWLKHYWVQLKDGGIIFFFYIYTLELLFWVFNFNQRGSRSLLWMKVMNGNSGIDLKGTEIATGMLNHLTPERTMKGKKKKVCINHQHSTLSRTISYFNCM